MHKLAYEPEDLKAHFDANTLERGTTYYHQSRVADIQYEPELYALFGNVQGSGNHVYQTAVVAEPGRHGRLRLQSQCDCPVGERCKHVVALLLAAHERFAGESSSPAPQAAEPALLNSAESAWLERVRTTLDGSLESEGGYTLVYLLQDLDAYSPRIELVKVKKLKKGGYGAPNPFKATKRWRDDGTLTPFDFELVEDSMNLLRGETGFDLNGRYATHLLERMVESGRCFLDDLQAAPLRRGAPVRGGFEWQVGDTGHQTLRLRVPSLPQGKVLKLDPPQLLCDGALHPIDCGMSAPAVQVLLDAPSISPEAVANLQPHLPAALPPLQTIARGEVRHITPKPILTFDSHFGIYYAGHMHWLRNQTILDMAVLAFDYDGLLIYPQDKRSTLPRWHSGRLDQIPRHIEAEKALIEQLRKIGLRPLDELKVVAGLREPNLYTLPPLHYDNPHKKQTAWRHDAETWRWLAAEALPVLRQHGWRLRFAPDFPYQSALEPDNWRISLEEKSDNDWFGMRLDIDVDGQTLPLRPIILDLLRQYPDLASLREQSHVQTRLADHRLLSLPTARLLPLLETLFDLFEQGGDELSLSPYDLGRLDELAETPDLLWQGGEKLREQARRLADFRGLAAVEPPRGLQATLRPYQLQGLAWLQFLREYGFGGILADDMGLGKTIQALAHLLTEKEAGRLDRPCLIVAPTSLVHNWRREAERFAPSLKLLILHGPQRQQHFDAVDQADLVITTYPLLARDLAHYQDRRFHYLLLDEAQQAKNAKTQTAQTIRQLHAHHRLCLTGTPMENHLGELWAQFDFLMPGWLGDEREFQRRWRTPIEKKGDGQRRAKLARRVAPFLLRRTKEQVATELPAKTETVQYLDLDQNQRDLYETVRLAMDEKVRKAVAEHGVARSHILILDALLKLRQVCCDPRLVKSQNGKQIASAKFAGLFDMLGELIGEGRRILLFSQFTSMLALIEEELQRRRIGYVRLAGDTADRDEPVERFQRGEVPLFLLSLKAGGVGLNLTAADTVIHYDPWWNPAVENQATDRAYRIGQDKPVFVYKLVTRGTVEEKILALQAKKAALAAGVLGDEAAALAALTAEELVTLLAPVEEED